MVKKQSTSQDFFLPDFCETQSVFMVVLIAQILAVIFTLLTLQPQSSPWNALGLYSISIQIVTLLSVGLLCFLRPYLAQVNDLVAGLISLLIILLITLLFSIALIHWYWLNEIDLANPIQMHLLVRNLLLSGIIGAFALRYFYLTQQYRKQLILESSARLEALQARIRPHFLFNCLNVIASLTRIDPAKAETAIEDLSDLFRATLDNKNELINFSEELINSEKYLAMESLRLGSRLKIQKNIDEAAMSILIPPLSLQPLLENAVYHGIQMLPEGGLVTVNVSVENNQMKIEINNPIAAQPSRKGNGIALANIAQRLEVIFAGKASLISQRGESEYKVTMKIPTSKA